MTRILKRKVMDAQAIDFALHRMAREIIEVTKGLSNLALIGIADGGIGITRRLFKILSDGAQKPIPMGMIDITLYRDDLTINDQPELKDTQIDFDMDGLEIVLVDDVLFTGRTVRAAITALLDYGRPGKIKLAVLVERIGHRELPIQADFVGRHIDTDKEEKVLVKVTAEGMEKNDKVVIQTEYSDKDGED